MKNIFQFKQFKIDQTNCAMKVNTDGVLLAALVQAKNPKRILDIGTGTGLIALMLAQRFETASIDAVEIDENAAKRAEINFKDSPFADRLTSFHTSVEDFYSNTDHVYDLIISNPPFFINSLKSEDSIKEQARHTNPIFFKNLLSQSAIKLSSNGIFVMILPIDTSILIEKLIELMPNLFVNEILMVHSFENSIPHRKILTISLKPSELNLKKFVIYESHGIYTSDYQDLLKDFLTIF